MALYTLFQKYETTKAIVDLKHRSRAKILQEEHFLSIDNTVAENVDMTSRQLFSALVTKYPELESVSLSTVKRARYFLEWESKKTRYCALISERNEENASSFARISSLKM